MLTGSINSQTGKRKTQHPVLQICLLLGLTLLLPLTHQAHARINVVGGNSPGNGGNVSCGNPRPNQNGYTTIQEAIDNANDGDEVVICPGTYNEAVDTNGLDRLSIRSSTGNPGDVTISSNNDAIDADRSDSLTVRDLTISSNGIGIGVTNGSGDYSFTNLQISVRNGDGVYLNANQGDGGSLTFSGGINSSAGNDGIEVHRVRTLIVTDTTIMAHDGGIHADDLGAGDHAITNVTIYSANEDALYLNANREDGGTLTVSGVLSSNNRDGMEVHRIDTLIADGVVASGGESGIYADDMGNGAHSLTGVNIRGRNRNGVYLNANREDGGSLTISGTIQSDNLDAIRVHNLRTLNADGVTAVANNRSGIYADDMGNGNHSFLSVDVTAPNRDAIYLNANRENGATASVSGIIRSTNQDGMEVHNLDSLDADGLEIVAGDRGIFADDMRGGGSSLTDLVIDAGNDGIYFNANRENGAVLTIAGVVRSQNRDGIEVHNLEELHIDDSEITASEYGVRAEDLDSGSNSIYNSCLYIRNPNNQYVRSNRSIDYNDGDRTGNFWGSLSGNSGYSDNCSDGNGDGVCDSPFNVPNGNGRDDYPLTACGTAEPPPPSSPVADWHLDEEAWSGNPAEVEDDTGNGHDGSASGGNSTVDPGKVCRSGEFDGSDDYIQVSGLSDLLRGTASLAFWIKTTQTGNNTDWQAPGVTGVEQNGGVDDIFWGWIDASGRIGISVGNDQSAKSSASINSGSWRHVVLTRDAGNGDYKIYIDGTLNASGRTGSGIIGTPFSSIGRIEDTGGSPEYFRGELDEILIFSSVLSDAQVGSIYSNQSAGNNWDGSERTCPALSSVCETFRDEFSSTSYGLNAGSLNWAGNWVETGDNGSPSNGDIEINNARLQLEGDGSGGSATFGGPSIERGADLSTFSSATLSFDYSESGNWEGNDDIDVWASGDGGTNWTRIRRFSNDQGSSTQSFSQDISDYIGSNTRIAFVELANSSSEVFYIDNVQIEACREVGGLDHIRILHDGQGLTCTPEEVTILACADSDCSNLYTDTVTVTLSPNGWVGGDTISFSGGSTTLSLQHTTAETVTLSATASPIATANPTQCYIGAIPSCSMTFTDAGFIFDVPDLTSCKPSAAVTITAVKLSDNGVSCAPAFTGTKTVNFWSGYNSPASGTQQVSINGTPIATAALGTGIDLTFDANARATFTARYPDAGMMTLTARYTGSGDDAGLILTGNDTFTARPAGLAVYSSDAGAACTPAGAGCSRFKKAGESFTLNVKAACWSSDSDTDLSDNGATPNFQLGPIALTHNLIEPAAGNPGSIGIGSFTFEQADAGIKSLSQSLSEVGVFTFTATPPNYFGSPLASATSANIGRFYPARLLITSNTPVFNNASESVNSIPFTYMGQEPGLGGFGFAVDPLFTITAQNLGGGYTQNYGGTFWKLDPSLNGRDFTSTVATAAGFSRESIGSTSLSGQDDFDATPPEIRLSDSRFMYSKPGTEEAPFDALVDLSLTATDLTDSDGVCYDESGSRCNTNDGDPGSGFTISGITGALLRYGQGIARDSYGTMGNAGESIDVTLGTLYWDGSQWQINEDDSSTNEALSYNSAEELGYATADSGVSTLTAPAAPLTLTGGETALRITLQADTDGGETLVTPAWPSWLSGGPPATAHFGIYRGDDRFIHWREVR